MNIYEKLAKARLELHKADIKKSGLNPFAKFPYYTLKDFIPFIITVEEKLGFVSVFSHGKDVTKLTLYNIEDTNETIVFETESRKSALKGAHDVQNLGAEHTYMKRYLYMNAFEITEGDALDENVGNPNMQVQSQEELENQRIATQAQLDKKKLPNELLVECGNDEAQWKRLMAKVVKDLGYNKYNDINFMEISKSVFKAKFIEALKLEQDLAKAGI